MDPDGRRDDVDHWLLTCRRNSPARVLAKYGAPNAPAQDELEDDKTKFVVFAATTTDEGLRETTRASWGALHASSAPMCCDSVEAGVHHDGECTVCLYLITLINLNVKRILVRVRWRPAASRRLSVFEHKTDRNSSSVPKKTDGLGQRVPGEIEFTVMSRPHSWPCRCASSWW